MKLLRPTHPYMPVGAGFFYLVAIMDWASPGGAGVAPVEHDGCVLLFGGAGGGAGAFGQAGDLQHRQSEDNRQFPGGLTLIPIGRLVGWRREAPGAA